MIRLNYPDMLQNIKMSIFTGDHSGIYSLASAIACISAMVSLLWWYNTMLNDPYGRLDVRSIVRSGAILFLTCNFYSFVLVPFDSVTHYVTKGVSAYVDKDNTGLWGKVNEVYADVQNSRNKETLSGEFEEEMANSLSSATAEDTQSTGESSSMLESLPEASVSAPAKKPGFFKRLWEGLKMAVSVKVGSVINDVGTIISWAISILAKLVQYILMALSSIYLIILGFIGPFVFAFALMPGFTNGIHNWIARYIQISFWMPMVSIVDFVNFKMKDALILEFWKAGFAAKLAYPLHLIVLDVLTIICLLGVPSLCAWIVSSAGASDVNRQIANTAAKSFMLKGKL